MIKYLKYYHPKKIISMFKRINELEKKMKMLVERPDIIWLQNNKEERMDALISDNDYTNIKRREFHLDRYNFAASFVKNKIVADIACGTGYGTRMLLENGEALKCTGIDIDKNAVFYAQRNHSVEQSNFICSPAEKTPLIDKSLDVIVSFETLEHVEYESLMIKEFSRILKNNGTLIISTPNKWPLSIAPFHSKEYDLTEFKKVLNEEFRVLEVYNQNSGTNWKYNHSQEKGIIKTTEINQDLAECFIAVCEKK